MKRILWDLEWAWMQVWPRLSQLAVAVFVIALGVALSSAVMLASASLHQSLDASMSALSGRAQLQVTAHGGVDFEETILPTVREVAGVAAAAPLLFKKVFVESSDAELRLVGVDMLDEATVRVYNASPDRNAGIDDPLVFLNQPDSVLLPRSFLRAHGFARGETVEIHSPSGRRVLTIRGVIDDDGIASAFSGNLGVMDLYSAQATLVAEGKLSQIDVRIASGADLDRVATRLKERLPGHLLVESIETHKARVRDLIAGFGLMMNFMSGLGLILAAVITGNRLSTIYQARMWEVGAMRALGTSPRGIVKSFLAEAAVLAGLGCLVGIPVGILLADFLAQPITDSMTLNFKQLGAQLSAPSAVNVTVMPLVLAITAGLGSALVAAWLPARRAARIPVHEALARGQSREPAPERPLKQRARLLVPPLALLSLAAQWAGFLGASGAAMILVPVAAGLLITPGLRLASRLVGERLGPAAAIGMEDQSLVPSRAVGAAGVIVAGIGFVGFIAIAGASFERYVVDSLMQTRRADLIVDSVFNETVGAVGENEPRLDEEIVVALGKVPGVRAAGAGVFARAHAPEVGIIAVDPVRLRVPEFGDWKILPGSIPNAREKVASGEAVLVDETLASSQGLETGSPIEIRTPRGLFNSTVAGITSSRSFQSANGDVILSRERYREAWADNTVTRVFLLLSDGTSPSETRELIVARLGDRFELRVVEPSDLTEWFAATVREGFSSTNWMMWLALVVVMVGTADALGATIRERTRELGAMRALGFTPNQIAGMVVAQAAAIGLVGTLLAFFVSLALSSAFLDGILPSALGWDVGIYVSPSALMVPASLGLIACLAGASLAAARAAAVSPIEALRYE